MTWYISVIGRNHRRVLFFIIISLVVFLGYKSLQAGHIRIIDKESHKRVGSIPSVQVGRYLFVSLEDYAKNLDIPFYPHDATKKVVLKISNHTVTVTALNPFIVIDGHIRQMPINVYYKDGDFLVPIQFFIESINDVFDSGAVYNRAKAQIEIVRSNANVVDVKIEEKSNGTLIRLITTRPFEQSNIYTSTSQGWLLVDIFGGQIDTGWMARASKGSIIKRIDAEQLSNETARVAFKLSSPLKEVRTYTDENANEILLTLRTREDVSQELLQELQRERSKWSIDCIIIDPGHGGKDPGAISRRGTYEKRITLAIAKKLKRLLEKRLSVKVVMTRESDKFVGLKERTQFANRHDGKLFISLHVNSYKSSRVGGCTTYFLGPAKNDQAREVARLENSVIKYEDSPDEYAEYSDANFILAANAQNSFSKESQDLAAIVQEEMKKRLPIQSRGVKQAGFYVLYGASMPCILHETAFISNRNEERLLRTSSFQQKVAEGLFESIRRFKAKYEMGI